MKRLGAGRRILTLVAIGAVLATLGLVGASGPLGATIGRVVSPLSRPFAGVGFGASGFFRDVARLGELARENSRLARENAELRARLAADAETRSDNELLRRQLGLDVAGGTRQIAAEVTSLAPDSYSRYVTINRGSSSGIGVGQAVMAEGVVAGLIASVTASSAKVMLVTDPRFALAGRDQAATGSASGGADGIISGRLGGSLLMDKIDRDREVKPGDTITTAGLGGKVPAGLVIGRVQAVSTADGAIFQSASVETPLSVASLRFLFVVVPTAVTP